MRSRRDPGDDFRNGFTPSDPEYEELNPNRIDLKPGRRSSARRRSEAKERGPGGLKSAMVRRNRPKGMLSAKPLVRKPKKPPIGRRKTVTMSAKGLMSRRTQKKVRRAMYRQTAASKMLACHACNRRDFITEKSLKRHTEKFHTPGAKSPRGYRTRRDS